MKELTYPDAGTAASVVSSQIRSWNRIYENYIYLIERWKRVAKDLRVGALENCDENSPQAAGEALGKAYKVVLDSSFIKNKLYGRVSIILTNPRVGDPVIVCEFLVGPQGDYLTIAGDILVEHPESPGEYQLILEAILKVIAA